MIPKEVHWKFLTKALYNSATNSPALDGRICSQSQNEQMLKGYTSNTV